MPASVAAFETRVAASERRGNNVGLLPESQGQNLALTVLCVPSLLDSGSREVQGPRLGSYLRLIDLCITQL